MNSFEKKQWIRIVLCTLAVAALALVLTGILGLAAVLGVETEPLSVVSAGADCQGNDNGKEYFLHHRLHY